MPAAAVIPAPIAYIKVVAVKKLVVGFRARRVGPPTVSTGVGAPSCRGRAPGLHCLGLGVGDVTLRKLECSKQAYARIL